MPETAEHVGGNWVLLDVRRTRFGERSVEASHLDLEVWNSRLSPELLSFSLMRPRYLAYRDLREMSVYLNRNGLDASAFEAARWSRLFYGFNILVMCVAVMPFAFGSLRSGGFGKRLFVGIAVDGALFTNITHDHLDYHKTFDNYIKAKKGFFDALNKDAFALVNADDRNGMVMLQNTAAKRYTYSLKSASDFKCKIIENSVYGLQLDIDGTDFHSLLIGEFNAYNLTLVYGAAILLGVEKLECLTVLSELFPPEGRLQVISPKNKIVAIVDYAHTPDALKNVLHTIRAIKTDNQKLITVVGCGGDRDKAKRPVMAQVAAK